MPPATVFSSKYRIDFLVGGNANAKRDSLVDEGPLKVASDHLFVKLLPAVEVPALGGGEHGWSQRLTEFLFLDEMEWSTDLRQRDFRWILLPARAAQALKDLDEAGAFGEDALGSVEELKALVAAGMARLPANQRELGLADVHAYAEVSPPTTLAEAITPVRLGGDVRVATAFKMSMVDGFVQARRVDAAGKFQATIDIILDASINQELSTTCLESSRYRTVHRTMLQRRSPSSASLFTSSTLRRT